MSRLIQIIYSSAAREDITEQDVRELLAQSREKNARLNISGILLFVDGSFFQVLEGEDETVAQLYKTISEDERHTNVTTIIREAIVKRAFAYWSMGYAALSTEEAASILGVNDFFHGGESFASLTEGRAQKLLLAFKQGRWRSHLSNLPSQDAYDPNHAFAAPEIATEPLHLSDDCECTFAFQPIINVTTDKIFSHEALIRGHHRESADWMLGHIGKALLHDFDTRCRVHAIKMASQLGLAAHLNLNMFPGNIDRLPATLEIILAGARQYGFHPHQIIVEILEHELIHDTSRFADTINDFRNTGLMFAIDDFGSGYAGLNLLADFQPDFIKLDMHLVRHIEREGARQAIIRGTVRTCADLGIEIIAEGVESREEYEWLRNEGITFFQGYLFAEPIFEGLSLPRN